MLNVIAQDNAVFMADFSQSFVITLSDSSTLSVHGIFDTEHIAMNEAGLDVSGYQPMITCKTADIPNVQADDILTINSSTYKIIDIQNDGTGMAKLILRYL